MSFPNSNEINGGGIFSGPVLPGGITGTPNTSGTNSFFALDSLSSSGMLPDTLANLTSTSPVLPRARITIGEFSRSVVSSLNKFKDVNNESDFIDNIKAKEAWYEPAALSSILARVKSAVRSLFGDESELFNTEQKNLIKYIKGPLADYNSFLDDTSGTMLNMYNAQVNYNLPPLTQAKTDFYNGKVDIWNANLGALNNDIHAKYAIYLNETNAINAKIAETNLTIDQINTQRRSFGIQSEIPHQIPLTIAPQPDDLPLISRGPPPPSSPTIPAGIAQVPIPNSQIISTSINLVPNTPQEAAFFASLQSQFDNINNGSLNNLNSEIVKTFPETELMFQAIQNFKNGSINQAQYDAAVTRYENYAATENIRLTSFGNAYIAAITAFNAPAHLKSINDQIKAFNLVRTANNQPTIPDQSAIPLPTDLLLPTPIPSDLTNFNFPINKSLILPVAPAGSITPTSASAYLETFYTNIYATELLTLGQYTKGLILKEAYQDFQKFILRGISNIENGYIERAPEIFLSPSPSAAGSGVALTGNIVGLQSSSISSIISNSILSAVRTKSGQGLSDAVVSDLVSGAVNALKNASLASALPSLSILSGNPEIAAAGGTAAKTVFSLSFLNTATSLIKDGIPKIGIEKILADSGMTPDVIAQLSGPITAAIELGLLQTAIFQVAQAIGLPGLMTQIIGNSEAGKAINGTLAASSGYGLTDVLNNAASMIALKQKLVKTVVSDGIWSASTAETLINDAINKMDIRNASINNYELSVRLVRGYKALGLDDSTAAKLVDVTQDFVRSEQINRDLDTAYTKQSINNQAVKDDLYQREDLQRALNSVNNNQLANQVTQDSIKSEYTKRDFRDDLISQLQVQGNDLAAARKTADLVLQSIRSDELKRSFVSTNIDKEQLNASLINGLAANGYGPVESQKIARSVLDTALAQELQSEIAVRESLEAALLVAGLKNKTASELSTQAALVLNNVNPLRDIRAGEILDHQALAEALQTEIKSKLKKGLGIQEASKVADQLVLALLGSAPGPTSQLPPDTRIAAVSPLVDSPDEVVTDQVARPTSVLNQINHAIASVREHHGKEADRVLTEDFRKFTSPSIDLFVFELQILDPGKRLFFEWGNMVSESKYKPLDVRI